MASNETQQVVIIPPGVAPSPVPANPEYDEVSAVVAARVREAEVRERRMARTRPIRWPFMLARILIDVLLVNIAFLLAYWARYEVQLVSGVLPEYHRTLAEMGLLQLFFTGMALAVFYARGVYAQARGAGWLDQMGRLAGAGLISICGVLLSSLLISPVVPSRLFFVYLWLSILLVFGVQRYAVKRIRQTLWTRGLNEHRVAVVGATQAGQRVMRHILDRPDLGYRLVGYVDDRSNERRWEVPFPPKLRPQRLGGLKDLEALIESEHLDELIIALGGTRRTNLSEMLERCSALRVNYRLLPDLMEIRFDQCEMETLDGIPAIGLKEPALRGGRLVLKRMMDIALALVMIILTSPLMLLIALAIRLEKPRGAILFRQKRAGRGGKVFTCLKFRSMRPDAEALKAQLMAHNEATGPIFKMKNDPRVTKVGRLLRKTSLDELPQFFNILKGEMSWVGPRPPTPNEVTAYSDWHLKRLEVTPGLTGLWQVSGRSHLTFDEMVTLDLYYAENWSLLLDWKVILQTVPAVLLQRGAY